MRSNELQVHRVGPNAERKFPETAKPEAAQRIPACRLRCPDREHRFNALRKRKLVEHGRQSWGVVGRDSPYFGMGGVVEIAEGS